MGAKIAIVTTITRPDYWQYAWKEALDCYCDLADEVIVVYGDKEHDEKLLAKYGKRDNLKSVYLHWPKVWHWRELPRHLNFGFDNVSKGIDYAIKMDIDYMFHENDWKGFTATVDEEKEAPVCATKKYNVLNRDVGHKKVSINNIVNMKFWDRIEFGRARDEETDWCFPIWSKDKRAVVEVYKTGFITFNYDYFFRTKEKAREAIWTFSQAYHRGTGKWDWGSTPDEALRFLIGRTKKKIYKVQLINNKHPKYIKDTILKMTPDQYGYNNWGLWKPDEHPNHA